jgi:hypothetical protein
MPTLLLTLLSLPLIAQDLPAFRQAASEAQPGDQILLAPGTYRGSLHLSGLRGTQEAPIVLGGGDPADLPVILGSIQISGASHLEVRDLVIDGAAHNGLNIDDAGDYQTPSRSILIRNVEVRNLPAGNHDGIKLSGLASFRVEGCRLAKWGGSGIDMVGCHDGVVSRCTFEHGGDSAVQAKGGSSQIQIVDCTFNDFGQRGVNIGGSTGREFFRPPLASIPAGKRFEAQAITVSRCTFQGGGAPVAFVGVDGAEVSFNTIYHPERWAARILQETRTPDFVPSRHGRFRRNIVVYRSDQWGSGGVNVGDGTEPESFDFSENFWHCSDQPEHRDVLLPGRAERNVYGEDPLLKDPEHGDLQPAANSPATKFGAHAPEEPQ